jgi:hypothetical protein
MVGFPVADLFDNVQVFKLPGVSTNKKFKKGNQVDKRCYRTSGILVSFNEFKASPVS